MSFCKFTDNSGNTYFLSAGQWIQPPDPGEYFEAIEILARIEHSELFRAEHSLFFQLDADFKQRLTRRLGRDWQNVEPTSSVLHPGASIQSSSTALPGRWPIILDAIYHGDIRLTKLAASPKTSKTSAAPVEDNRALLRVKIRQALAAIVTQEKVEAAQHTRMLGQESRAGRATVYTGAFFTGLWNAGTDFAQWLKEVNDVLNPLQRSLRGIRAGHSALQRNSKTGENLLAAYQDEVLTAEKRELVQVLGFDPSQLSREQFQQAIELADLIWEDPALQGDLRRFAKDYVQAQHVIEITEFSGAAAFEVLFTILLAAITGGAGLAASSAGLTWHFARFRKVGDLLVAFGRATKKIRERGNARLSSTKSKPSLAEMPFDEVELPSQTATSQHKTKRDKAPDKTPTATISPQQVDWNTSGPEGLKVQDPRDFATGREIFDTLVENGLEPDMAFRISRELLESGTEEPIRTTIKKGESLYKIVPKNGKPPADTSPYFMTESMLKQLPDDASAAGDILGLPQVASAFDTYEITASEDVVVYQSSIAKFTVNDGAFVRQGGGTQSLVIERKKFTKPNKVK